MSNPNPSSNAPPKISLFLSSAPKKPSAPPKKRSAATALGHDSDSEDDTTHRGKVQLVSSFDSRKGGAISKDAPVKQKDTPLVIPALKNKDWRAEAEARKGGAGRGKKIWVPEEAQKRELKPEDLVEQENTGEGQKWGLVITAPSKADDREENGADGDADQEKPKPMTEDEIAMAALMGQDVNRKDLVIEAAAGDSNDWRDRAPENEDDAYRRDVSSRPDIPTLADYAAVPVEEFGAALLRGMGWKGGEDLRGNGKANGKGRKPKEKRPAFLGIGAKPQSEVPELGAWGKGDKAGKNKGRRVDTTYVPVVMVDRRTGQVVDEKELAAKKDAAKKDAADSDRKETKDDDRRTKDRSRDRDRRRGDRNGRSERDRDSGKQPSERRERSHRDRDDRDRERNRDRDRERDRDRRRDDRRDRDRRDYDDDRDRDRRRRR
ncbi:hypothetical protein EX30DRAFT_147883 [Ascodesmis nigricans]|uniref:Pre-mRNA-splicing factor n=1 Tax=Ascodesmis nigricans TaxID=341454 RepID=A0A4S2N255_9PEZI|nr:hypothetical protein EX30DRAFT_147883 [Ascodesmis nigricans]